jgi:hypothetical protein
MSRRLLDDQATGRWILILYQGWLWALIQYGVGGIKRQPRPTR